MHTKFTQLMSLALDNEASAEDMRCLRAHLQACPACAATWAQWQAIDRQLAVAPQMAPVVSLVSLVSQRLVERELRRRRTRWVGSGLLLTWLLVFGVGLAGMIGAASWVAAHPQLIASMLSGVAHFLSGATWLLHELVRLLSELGAPRLAAVVGLFVTLTCGLAVMWLWLMGRSRLWTRSPALAGR